jgi:hypothetical protein
MNTASNGSCPPAGQKPPSATPSTSNTEPAPKLFPSLQSHDPAVLSFEARRAQRQRIKAAAQAHARSGSVIWNSLLMVLMLLAFMTAGVALHREQQLQQMERGARSW